MRKDEQLGDEKRPGKIAAQHDANGLAARTASERLSFERGEIERCRRLTGEFELR